MAEDAAQTREHDLVQEGLSAVLDPVRVVLTKAGESERYRLLASLLTQLADQAQGANGREDSGEQVRALGRKIQDLQRDNADLQDQLRMAQADLERRDKQLEAEVTRGRELSAANEEQRHRREESQKELEEVQAQLVARNRDIHRLENERDDLQLRLQRVEMKAGDRTQLDTLEEGKRDLNARVAELQGELQRLRTERDAEVESLRARLREQGAGVSQEADALLMRLWDRLAQAKPDSLAQGGVQPTEPAAENLVDTFIELVQFINKYDQDMRVFLNRYTRHHQAISRQWQVYAAREDFNLAVQQTIAPQNPKQVGVLRLKLKAFHKFCFSAMVASDAVIESIASELQSHLLGEHGTGADANAKIRDYIRNDCHELFMDHIKRLRSEKMAEVFIRG